MPGESGLVTTSPLISLDQMLILFDVDQLKNAKQEITIKKVSNKKCVAWRALVNAPTRYIVKPNGGLLSEDTKVTIELVNNRYIPQHQMVIEAIAFEDEKRYPALWTMKHLVSDEMQVVELELSTTLVNIDSATHLTDEQTPTSLSLVTQILEMSHTKDAERVKELQSLLHMLRSDNETLAKNQVQTEKLQRVLKEQIAAKKTQTDEMTKKCLAVENELKLIRENKLSINVPRPPTYPTPPNCSLM